MRASLKRQAGESSKRQIHRWLPYGYTKHGDAIVVVKKEAVIVEQILGWESEGRTLQWICDRLNSEKSKPNVIAGGMFQPSEAFSKTDFTPAEWSLKARLSKLITKQLFLMGYSASVINGRKIISKYSLTFQNYSETKQLLNILMK